MPRQKIAKEDRQRVEQACEQCVGRKAKCDGKSRCGRCTKRGFVCTYGRRNTREYSMAVTEPVSEAYGIESYVKDCINAYIESHDSEFFDIGSINFEDCMNAYGETHCPEPFDIGSFDFEDCEAVYLKQSKDAVLASEDTNILAVQEAVRNDELVIYIRAQLANTLWDVIKMIKGAFLAVPKEDGVIDVSDEWSFKGLQDDFELYSRTDASVASYGLALELVDELEGNIELDIPDDAKSEQEAEPSLEYSVYSGKRDHIENLIRYLTNPEIEGDGGQYWRDVARYQAELAAAEYQH